MEQDGSFVKRRKPEKEWKMESGSQRDDTGQIIALETT